MSAGKTPVFLLKTRSSPNDGYEEQFSAGGQYEPAFVPVLQHQLLEEGLSAVRDALRGNEIGRQVNARYGGLIFTSQRAVEAFAKLVEEGGDSSWPNLQDVPIYTVGPATSRALRSISHQPPLEIFGSEMGNGEALAHFILDHYVECYKDRQTKPPLLFLVGEQRRDIIPKTLMNPALPQDRRIQVDELVVYGTGVMDSFEEDFTNILNQTEESDVRWVVVFSPTGCEAMLRALGMLDVRTGNVRVGERSGKTYIATIGPTTRDYLKSQFEYEPDVCAEKPSPEGIAAGIEAFLKDKPCIN